MSKGSEFTKTAPSGGFLSAFLLRKRVATAAIPATQALPGPCAPCRFSAALRAVGLFPAGYAVSRSRSDDCRLAIVGAKGALLRQLV